MMEQPYNPLSRVNLGKSVADALLMREPVPLTPVPRRKSIVQSTGLNQFPGAGIYAIYYIGDFPLYQPIVEQNRDDFKIPIYVGKADPKGARTGIFDSAGLDDQPLYERLRQHASSIRAVDNLKLEDFYCRYLVVEDIWIPLGESLLINRFKPVWNKFGGFGIHQPGKGRLEQRRSIWDTLHPGRRWTNRLPPNSLPIKQIEAIISAYLGGNIAIPDIEPEN